MNRTEIEQSILNLLQDNARMSSREIADRLGVAVEDIDSRIAALEDEQVLIGYHAVINQDALAATRVRAIIEVEVQPERDGGFDRVARMISRFEEVENVFLVSGRYDLRLEVVGDSLQQVAFFVASKLAPLSGVQATATHFILKKYKEAGFEFERDEDYERLKVTP